jgi:hypothetical protein
MVKKTTTRKTKKTAKKAKKVLNTHLYAYCTKANATYARTKGKQEFGSFSAYINALIASDRGVKTRTPTTHAR